MRMRKLPPPSSWARWLAAGVAVVAISIGGTLAGRSQQGLSPIDGRGIALIGVAGAMVAFARRWPIVAFAVAIVATDAYIVLGYPSDSPYLLGLLATAYLASAPDRRSRGLLFAGATLVILAAGVVAAPATSGTSAALAALVLAALAAGQLAAELSARSERRAEEAREHEAQRRLAEERLAIARDLHDLVSRSIALINVQAGVAVHVMGEQPEQARAALITIKSTSHQALEGLREILGLLRHDGDRPSWGPTPGLAELPELLDDVGAAGVAVQVDADIPEAMPATTDITAYRVVSEALSNIVRHAPGATARVKLEARSGRLLIEVVDDGAPPGAAPEASGAGWGLVGLRERVRAAGGELAAGPRVQGGYTVQAWLPLAETAS